VAYFIEFDVEAGILTVTQTGTVTLESRRKLLEEILATIPEDGELKVLSDLREADISMSSDEAIKYGELIAQEGGSRRALIAMVHPKDKANTHLVESVMLLEGEHLRVVSFSSIKEAYQWLRET